FGRDVARELAAITNNTLVLGGSHDVAFLKDLQELCGTTEVLKTSATVNRGAPGRPFDRQQPLPRPRPRTRPARPPDPAPGRRHWPGPPAGGQPPAPPRRTPAAHRPRRLARHPARDHRHPRPRRPHPRPAAGAAPP